MTYLAEKYGIDTERYFIIGVQLYVGETRGDALGAVSVSLIATDTQRVKAYGVGPISDWVRQNGGTLPYVRFDIDASIEEVLLSFKRFEVVMINSHVANVRAYKSTIE